MHRRAQAEMYQLVAKAGFRKIEQRIDRWGIFTVSLGGVFGFGCVFGIIQINFPHASIRTKSRCRGCSDTVWMSGNRSFVSLRSFRCPFAFAFALALALAAFSRTNRWFGCWGWSWSTAF